MQLVKRETVNADGIVNDGFMGNGMTCNSWWKFQWKDCYELYIAGIHIDGVYTITPGTAFENLHPGVQAYCGNVN